MAWLLVVATIPVGIVGLAFEHTLRTVFAKPLAAACFPTANGVMLLAGERFKRRAEVRELARADRGQAVTEEEGRQLDTLDFREAGVSGRPRPSPCWPGSADRAPPWWRDWPGA